MSQRQSRSPLLFADELWILRDRSSRFNPKVFQSEKVAQILSLAESFEPTDNDSYTTTWLSFWIRFPHHTWEEHTADEDLSYYDAEELEYAKWHFGYDYPDDFIYYKVTVIEDRVHIENLAFTTPGDSILGLHYDIEKSPDGDLTDKLLDAILIAMQEIAADVDDYNNHIANDLPNRYRKGRIKRSHFWQYHEDSKAYFFKYLSPEMLEWFLSYEPGELCPMPCTSGLFLDLCKVAYLANEKELTSSENRDIQSDLSKLSPEKLYRMFADGRHDGLLDLDRNSESEYSEWKYFGGHPFEIFSGGNPTHIDLFPRKIEGGYIFELTSGQIITSRAIEAINAYFALVEAKYPVELCDHQRLREVVRGEDFIGIEPFDVMPRRVRGYFPDEDKVNDSLNLRHLSDDEDEFDPELLDKIKWYPEKKVCLK